MSALRKLRRGAIARRIGAAGMRDAFRFQRAFDKVTNQYRQQVLGELLRPAPTNHEQTSGSERAGGQEAAT